MADERLCVDPIGECVDFDEASIDELAEAYLRAARNVEAWRETKRELAMELASRTRGDKKTRRLAGKNTRIRVEMPSTSFDQQTLKTLVRRYPALSERYMRIDRYAVNRREVDKIRGIQTDQDDLAAFYSALLDAEYETGAAPRIVVEEGE